MEEVVPEVQEVEPAEQIEENAKAAEQEAAEKLAEEGKAAEEEFLKANFEDSVPQLEDQRIAPQIPQRRVRINRTNAGNGMTF